MNQTINRPKEIVLVDSSEDGVSDWIRSTFPSVQVISSPSRLGPGAARNLGTQKARGEFLAFLDADVIPESDWTARSIDRMRKTPEIQVLGGSVANANPQSCASKILYWIEFSEFLPGSSSGFRPYLSGSNLIFRREVFAEIDGFPTDIMMSEDLELFSRNRLQVYFDSSVQVEHFHRSRWASAMQHLSSLGYWSGVFRLKASRPVKGSWLKKFPLATWLTIPYRLVQILLRIWAHQPLEGIRAVAYFPLLLLGLIHWTLGFYRGICGTENSRG